jgi:osmotically inducible lipoprotein OsmB
LHEPRGLRSMMGLRFIRLTVVGCLTLSLAACGYSRGDRAASGALIGAGSGAAISALTGGAPLIGAAIGAGAGALGGALTSGHGINLGRPIWR